MNQIFDTYLEMFNKNSKTILKEDTDDWGDTTNNSSENSDNTNSDDSNTSENNDDTEFASDDNETTNISNIEEQNIKGAELKFSADLASEFGKTCNKFTNLAAKAVKQRTVDTETTKQLTTILDKLKSLLDVAKQSSEE